MRVSPHSYKKNTNKKVQCTNIALGNTIVTSDECEYDFQKIIFKKMKKQTSIILSKMCNHKQKGKMHLFGFDYMLNNDLEPYLLEINSYPGLNVNKDKKWYKIKKKMLADMLFLYIDPSNYRHKKYVNNWEQI
jgi:hypothetical protein